jgi:hypothetical protein
MHGSAGKIPSGADRQNNKFGAGEMKNTIQAVLLTVCVVASVVGCSSSPKKETIDGLVTEIGKHAAADDTAFFAHYMDASAKGQAPQMLKQIKASDMASNFTNRLETISDTKSRLNYHYLERGCHFQVDLEKQDGLWVIRRMWFCR